MMRAIFGTIGAAVLVLIVLANAYGDDGRMFMGQRHFVGGQGNTRACYPRELHLKLTGNVLSSSEAPSCTATVAADGSITGHCPLSTDTVDISGRLSGHTIMLHTTHTSLDKSTICEYDTQMEEYK